MLKLTAKALLLAAAGISLVVPSLLNAARSPVLYKDQVAIIMYHHIDDDAKSGGTITTDLFQKQLTYLKGKNYQFITLKQFKDYMDGASVPNNAVLVTFDDGYESFYTNAYPILKTMRIPAVNFVITGDLDNPLASYIPSLSRDEIAEMTHDTNFIDAQCHTNSFHNRLPDGSATLIGRMLVNGQPETAEQYKQRVVSDTRMCISKLSGLYGETVDSYAFPFGIYDKQSLEYVREGGIKYGFTIVPEMTTRDMDRMQLPRINAGSSFITPEGLHNSILRRVVAVSPAVSDVDLAAVMNQIGGKASVSGSSVTIQYQGKQWTGKINSLDVASADGQIRMRKPLQLRSGKTQIGFDDLQAVLGVQLVYNPNGESYSVRLTPYPK